MGSKVVDPMATLKKRLLASVVLTLLSLVSIGLLLPTSKARQLQKITLGTSIDNFGDIWKWADEEVEDDKVEETGGGIRMVVFGDSWVDDSTENGGNGKGRSWPQVLCEEINCTSRLNFAASQPGDAFPSLEPTGVATSNQVHASAVAGDKTIPVKTSDVPPLPDLAAQIQSFIALPIPKEQPKQTIFVLSFGFWDIYEFARLKYDIGQNATNTSLDVLFNQMDILYLHYANKLYPSQAPPELTVEVSNSTEVLNENNKNNNHSFRIIIPRLFDPTLLPGWLSHRPLPISPSSVAEQQKNAVYLTDRWNQLLENKMGAWMKSPPPLPNLVPLQIAPPILEGAEESAEVSHTDIREPVPSSSVPSTSISARDFKVKPRSGVIEKDIFYYDVAKYLLDIIVEHSLEDEGLSDASGLGKGESPYDSVYAPCLREAEEGEDTAGFVDLNGLLVCKEPRDYLFWDAWGLGPVAKEEIGRQVGKMVLEGQSLKAAWDKSAARE